MTTPVQFYDATLTAGLWRQGHHLPLARRQTLARHLDAGQVDYLEITFWDPERAAWVWMVEETFTPQHARASAYVPLSADAATNQDRIQAFLATALGAVTLGVPTAASATVWRASVQQVQEAGRRALVLLHDFYRQQRRDPTSAWAAFDAARQAGATAITLADEYGEALPWEMSTLVYRARRRAPAALLGVWSGNANACADDNALVAVQQGARLIYGTLHGHGQGRGFADLTHVRATLFREAGAQRAESTALRHLWETGQTLDRWLYRMPA